MTDNGREDGRGRGRGRGERREPLVVLLEIIFNEIFGGKLDFTKGSLDGDVRTGRGLIDQTFPRVFKKK